MNTLFMTLLLLVRPNAGITEDDVPGITAVPKAVSTSFPALLRSAREGLSLIYQHTVCSGAYAPVDFDRDLPTAVQGERWEKGWRDRVP